MSSETAATPKKSILTDAMERARAIKDAKESAENNTPTEKELAVKRGLKAAGLFLAGAAAAVTAVIVVTKLKTEDETSDEETVTED